MTLAESLAAAEDALARAGVETPRLDAEWLLADVLDAARLTLHLRGGDPLPPEPAARFAAHVARRARREPLQHIVGSQDFRGLRLRVTSDVLVPRPETEVLVDLALRLLPPTGPATVVDVGTGSGCVAAAIAAERAGACVIAVDDASDAAILARANATGLAVHVIVGDLLAALRGGCADLVVSNPPYLPTRLLGTLMPEVVVHEPRRALDGGGDGLDVVRRLVPDARRVLRRGGALALETNGGGQADAAAALLVQVGFVDVRVQPDLAGVVRFVTGRRH